MRKPFVIKLPSELKEISGLTYYQKDNSLFVESDEKGCIYKIFLNKPTDIRKWKFGHKKDFEDLVLLDSIFYILNANGDVSTLQFVNDTLKATKYDFIDKGNEFESLYYDPKLRKMVIICKDCNADTKAATSTYTFDPVTHEYAPSFIIDAGKIEAHLGAGASKFKPSAASINPVTGELFILSAINKVMVVADRRGVLKEVYHLDPALYNHPEGLAFSPNGGMFISNEAGTTEPATILYYQFNKKSVK